MSIWILMTSLIFASKQGLLVDRIAARVEDEVILLSDLTKKVELIYGSKVEYREDDARISKMFHNVLDELIEDRILQMELKKIGQDLTESEIKAAIEDVRKQRGLSEEEFTDLIRKEGLSYEQYKEEMKRQLRKNKFMALRIRQRVKITDEDARLFYNQEFGAKNRNRPCDVSMIFISKLNKDFKERLEAVRRELDEKKEFSEIAKRYSDDPSNASGGHIGAVSRGDMREEFERVIFELKENEVSDVLNMPEGFYIFKVNKIIEPQIKDFDEAKEDIKRMLFEKEMLKQYSYVIDSLKKKYTIYVNLK